MEAKRFLDLVFDMTVPEQTNPRAHEMKGHGSGMRGQGLGYEERQGLGYERGVAPSSTPGGGAATSTLGSNAVLDSASRIRV